MMTIAPTMMSRDDFEQLAQEAWDAIPAEIKRHFANVCQTPLV
jgi:predicted Zn-dependent protease with MMP-like domain